MPYYYFDKCEEAAIFEIERLARELSMEEGHCSSYSRQWTRNRNPNSDIYVIGYDPGFCECPLLIKTHPDRDYKNENIRGIIKKIIKITGSTTVESFALPYVRKVNSSL